MSVETNHSSFAGRHERWEGAVLPVRRHGRQRRTRLVVRPRSGDAAALQPREGTPMKAAVLHEANKPLVIEDVSVQQARPARGADPHGVSPASATPTCTSWKGSIRIRCRRCSGHESAGVVEEVGSDVTYVKPGDHVITCLSVFCGTCEQLHDRPSGALHRHRGEAAAGRVQPAVLEHGRRSCTSSSTCRRSPSRCWCTRTPS